MSYALIASLLFCVLYGLQIVLQSLFLRGAIHPIQLMFLTNTMSFLILTFVHGASNRKVFHIRLSGMTIALFAVTTALWIIADLSSIIGLSLSSSVNLSILSRMQLFITYIGAVLFLGESFTAQKAVAVLLAFVGGLITVSRGQAVQFNVGDGLFVIFTLAISISGLFRQRVGGKMDVHQMTYLMYGISSVITGVLVGLADPLAGIPVPGFIVVNALLSLTGFTCVNYAITKGGAAQFSLASNLLPIMTAVFAFGILGETLHTNQFIGAVGIIAGIVLFVSRGVKRKLVDTVLK